MANKKNGKEPEEAQPVEEKEEKKVDERPQEEKSPEEQAYGYTPPEAPPEIVIKGAIQRNIQ